MTTSPRLTEERISELAKVAESLGDEGKLDEAFAAAEPLRAAVATDAVAARALARLIWIGSFPVEASRALGATLFDWHGDDPVVVGRLGRAFETWVDIRFLNAAPSSDPLLVRIFGRLRELLDRDDVDPKPVHYGLATAARLLGRRWDAVAEASNRWLVEHHPDVWYEHYGLGLFYKTRGRFAEGLAANVAALERGGEAVESVLWNLAICATGAGDGARALDVWKRLGMRIEAGRFGLPEGPFGDVKVRLAERPIAERDVANEPDDPGAEETIWIERLSPCHGIVRSATFEDLGVDYGDVVLFDGAPIKHETYGDERIPVFPHLATLVRAGYRIYGFIGAQSKKGEIASLSRSLPRDSVLYVHTEQVVFYCKACSDAPDSHHRHDARDERPIVAGKLCAPHDLDPGELLATLDALVAENPALEVLVPDLVYDAGDAARAEADARRADELDPARG